MSYQNYELCAPGTAEKLPPGMPITPLISQSIPVPTHGFKVSMKYKKTATTKGGDQHHH
jgi:hypothetical protein